MFKNCFLSTKVSFCNEIYQFCQIKGIDYETVRRIAANDDRILHGHTFVPGPDGKKGFGGTCFPKDTNSLRYEMIKLQKSIVWKSYVFPMSYFLTVYIENFNIYFFLFAVLNW